VFVEDEDALRRAGCRILEAAGYRVVPAANDLDALRLIDELVVPISVVVTDVVMPGMNGKELAAPAAGSSSRRATASSRRRMAWTRCASSTSSAPRSVRSSPTW